MRPDLFARLLVDEPVPLSMSMPFQGQHSLYENGYSKGVEGKKGRDNLRLIQAFRLPWIYPAHLYNIYVSIENIINTCDHEQ